MKMKNFSHHRFSDILQQLRGPGDQHLERFQIILGLAMSTALEKRTPCLIARMKMEKFVVVVKLLEWYVSLVCNAKRTRF
jgi:hypothetical protein